MDQDTQSKSLKAGSKYYFFDAKKAKNGKKYLQITESRLNEKGERVRNTIIVFPEQREDFLGALKEMAALI